MTDLRAHSEMNAFYIIPANTKKSLLGLFSTHPPVEQRIAAARSGWRRSCRARARARLDGVPRQRCSGARRPSRSRRQDRLFALTTAYITLETEHNITTRGEAAIVFQPVDTADFDEDRHGDGGARARHRRGDRARRSTRRDDTFGYRWMILRDPDVEDLVVGDQRGQRRARRRRLRRPHARGGLRLQGRARPPAVPHLQLQARHLVPVRARRGASRQRDAERELQLKAILDPELPVEPELERWFPMWGIPI